MDVLLFFAYVIIWSLILISDLQCKIFDTLNISKNYFTKILIGWHKLKYTWSQTVLKKLPWVKNIIPAKTLLNKKKRCETIHSEMNSSEVTTAVSEINSTVNSEIDSTVDNYSAFWYPIPEFQGKFDLFLTFGPIIY